MIDATAILALISDLYGQVAQLQAENAALRKETEPTPPTGETTAR